MTGSRFGKMTMERGAGTTMQQIDPNAQYDIKLFNQNFQEVQDTVNSLTDYLTSAWIRPADWLHLPEITDETEQVVYMLCHIMNTEKVPIAFRVYNAANTGTYRVEWGDGTGDTYTASSSVYAHHVYNFAALTAPMTGMGEKQVIVKVRQIEGAMEWFTVSPLSYPVLASNAVVVSIRANMPLDGTLYPLSVYRLAEVDAIHLKSAQISNCQEMKRFSCASPKLTDVYITSSYGLVSLDIPKDNAYTRIHLTNVRQLREFECNAANVTVQVYVSMAYPLTKLKLNGLRYKLNATYSAMNRPALVELFKSFGTANGAQAIDVRNCPGFADLTDADFAIVTGKGFTVTR